MFCLDEVTLSREHLFSDPICDTFGIDRSSLVAGVDTRNKRVSHAEPLATRKVKLPCKSCNNGWMSDLENDAAAVFDGFAHHDVELSADDIAVIGRWAAKSLVALQWGELDARKFMSSPGVGAVPAVTLARQVFAGAVPKSVSIAAGSLTEPNPVIWSAGNPKVATADPEQLNCRVVNTAAFNLGRLQLWVIAPLFNPSELKLPEGTIQLRPGTRFEALPLTSPILDFDRVETVFDQPTTTAILWSLNHVATHGISL